MGRILSDNLLLGRRTECSISSGPYLRLKFFGSRGCPMGAGRRVAGVVGVVLVAATSFILPETTARADPGCSFNDFLNSLENLGSAITSSACDAAYASGIGTGLVVGLGGALAGVMAEDSNTGNQICQQVQNDFNNLGNAQNDIGTLQNILSQYPAASSVLQTIEQSVSDYAANPLGAAACACDWVQGLGQLGGDALSCLQDAICGLQEDLGWGGCGCTPPTPVLANCTPPVATCTGYSSTDPNTLPQCQNTIIQQQGYNPPSVVVQHTSSGTVVIDVSDGWDGHSQYCAPDRYCFCPSPMTAEPADDYYLNAGSNNGYVMWVCACPKGTHAGAQSGPLAMVCICDDTGLPAVPPVKSTINPTASICPLPLTGIPCPNGQVNWAGKCVAACAKGDVRAPDGKCCNPNQVTYCGQCCPPGYIPDPVKGICYKPQPIQ